MNGKRYINEFFRLTCAPDLLALKVFPNAKEVTESMAAYHAVRVHLLDSCNINLNDPQNALVAVGDGYTPRTAALFAFRSKWMCFSIDPLLRTKQYNVKRLWLDQCRIEECHFNFRFSEWNNVIVVLVHNHAPMKAVLGAIEAKPSKLHIVAIPCCAEQNIPGKIDIGYTDTNIWSPKNEVRIWRKL